MSETGGEGACRTLADFALPSEPGNEREAMEQVAEAVRGYHRCIVPTLPPSVHRRPMLPSGGRGAASAGRDYILLPGI